MKNIFKATLCVLALSLGMFSCNTEDPGSDTGGGEGKEGQVVINLGFDKTPSTQASYPTSTAKPTTSWTDNIKDLHILFVSTADNRVKAARELQLPQDGTTGTHNFVLQNIPASPAGAHYNVYVVADRKQHRTHLGTGRRRRVRDQHPAHETPGETPRGATGSSGRESREGFQGV
jgi:hypothetical protein